MAATPRADLSFAEFEKLYTETFRRMMTYDPRKHVGSAIYVEKLAALADAYPEWAETVENAEVAR